MHIIAYTYVADHHCIDCTVEKFHYSKQTWINWDFNIPHPASDENGIHVAQEDSYGEIVHPVFSWDEWQELDEVYLSENPTQRLICGDCFKTIDEYTVEGDAYED